MKILLIEDEKDLSMALSELLLCEGFSVDTAYNGIDGLDSALSGIYGVIVLDIMLPKMNGIDVLKEIRKNHISSAVLMLTAKSEMEDKITGLRSGADDYLTKPFVTEEFLARIWALSRRNHFTYVGEQISFGDIVLDQSHHTVKKDEGKIGLSSREYEIMELLMRNPETVFTKEKIIEKIWGFDSEIEYNAIEVYIFFLRKKLKDLESLVTIKTVRSVGYTLEELK